MESSGVVVVWHGVVEESSFTSLLLRLQSGVIVGNSTLGCRRYLVGKVGSVVFGDKVLFWATDKSILDRKAVELESTIGDFLKGIPPKLKYSTA